MVDKNPTSEVIEVIPIPLASGVTQGNNHGIRPSEEEDNWVTPGRNVDLTYLIYEKQHEANSHNEQ